jgi:hypothetical protein
MVPSHLVLARRMRCLITGRNKVSVGSCRYNEDYASKIDLDMIKNQTNSVQVTAYPTIHLVIVVISEMFPSDITLCSILHAMHTQAHVQ